MTAALTDAARRLLDGRSFATVATVNPDGQPQTSVVWVARDGDAVLFSTTASRQKARNLRRDPRISIMLFDSEDPYRTVEIRGTAELVEDKAKALSKTLNHKYLGQDPAPEPEDVIRLIVRVVPNTITGFLGKNARSEDE